MPYLIQQEVFIDQMGHPVQMHYYRTNLKRDGGNSGGLLELHDATVRVGI